MEELPTGSTPYLFNVSLKLILENEKGEVLGMRCREGDALEGYYDFPGGRINADELHTPYAEIIEREVREEAGEEVRYEIDLQPVAIARYPYFSQRLKRESCSLMVFFRARYQGGEIKASEEHSGYDWLKLDAENLPCYFTSGFLEGAAGYLQRRERP